MSPVSSTSDNLQASAPALSPNDVSTSPPPYSEFREGTTITHRPYHDTPIHQRVLNQIERQAAFFAHACGTTIMSRVAGGIVLGAMGGPTLAHYTGNHERIDLLSATVFGGLAGGTAVAMFGLCVALPLEQFFAARYAAAQQDNDVALGLLTPADDAV